AGVARGQGAQATEQVGDGAAAHREEGGQRQQDEAAMSRSGQGRGQGLEDGVDRPGELAADPLELAAAEAGLASHLAALSRGDPPLPASAEARRSGAVGVSGAVRVAPWDRGRPLATADVYTGHGSLLVCDVRAGSYPPLHRGGSPRRNPTKGKESNSAPLADGGFRQRLALDGDGLTLDGDGLIVRVVVDVEAGIRQAEDEGACHHLAVQLLEERRLLRGRGGLGPTGGLAGCERGRLLRVGQLAV